MKMEGSSLHRWLKEQILLTAEVLSHELVILLNYFTTSSHFFTAPSRLEDHPLVLHHFSIAPSCFLLLFGILI